ncbi:hypothetical protein MY4824_009057 [Beauveria thailandica]
MEQPPFCISSHDRGVHFEPATKACVCWCATVAYGPTGRGQKSNRLAILDTVA